MLFKLILFALRLTFSNWYALNVNFDLFSCDVTGGQVETCRCSIFSIFKQLKFLYNDKYFSLLIFPDPAWVRQADVADSQPHLWLHISTRHVPRDSVQAFHVTNSLQVVMKEFLILVQTQFYTFYVQLLNIYRFYHPILKSQSCIKTL